MRWLCVLVLGWLTAAGALAADPPPDGRLLQGEWEAVDVEVQGQKMPADKVKSFRLVVKGDRMTLWVGKDRADYTYHLDPARKPKALDLTPEAGEEKGKRLPAGIYELDGNKLRVCLNDRTRREVARPKEFKCLPGKAMVLMTLNRVEK